MPTWSIASEAAVIPLCFAAALACIRLARDGMRGFDSSNPAPVEQAQMKKAQEYMGNYREQMVAANKGKAKSKAKTAENSPK